MTRHRAPSSPSIHPAPARSALRLALLAGGSIALFAGHVAAQTDVQWNNASGGSWSQASNWSTNQVPNNSGPNRFNALITLDGVYAVALATPITVTNLQLQNAVGTIDLNLAGRALSVLGTHQQVGEAVLGGGAGNSLTIRGAATFDTALLMQTRVTTFGPLNFIGASDNDICDSDVDHRGAAATLTGTGRLIIQGTSGRFTNNFASTFTLASAAPITGTGGGRFVNNGRLVKNGPASTTDIDTVEFANLGTVDVQTGTLRANLLAPSTLTGTTLSTGTYRVANGATLDFVGASITTLNADVTLTGTGAFAALDNLALITPSGKLALAGGRDFTTTGNFTNNGQLTLGAGSDFTVAGGSAFTNVSGGTLAGGTYNLTGRLLADLGGTDITSLDARLTLDGTNSLIGDTSASNADRLANLSRIVTGGEFTTRNGRAFSTGAATFTVEPTARVTAGTNSTISLGNLANFASNTLTDGVYVAQGTLRWNDAAILTLNANLTLDGALSAVRNQTNNADALAALATISTARTFTVTGGRDYATSTTAFSLDSATLVVGKNSIVRAQSATTFSFTGGTLDISGELRFPGAAFTSVPSGVFVRPGGRITNSTNGLDAFSALNLIQTGAQFSVAPGESRTLAGSLSSQSTAILAVGEAGDTAATLNIPGNFNQAGATSLGGGALNVTGTYALTGPTTGTGIITAGQIVLGPGGSIAAGNSPGMLEIVGETAIGEGASLVFEIGATDTLAGVRGILNDFILFNGLVIHQGPQGLAGDVRYSFISAFTPEIGEQFVLAQATGGVTGTFARAVPFNTGIAAQVAWVNNELVLTVVAMPSPGAIAPLALASLALLRRRR